MDSSQSKRPRLEIKKGSKVNWSNKLADKVQSLKPSGIREFFDIVASRPDYISLGVGEPDFVSPNPIINRATDALKDGYTHYTGNQGMLELREEISKYLKSEYSLCYDPNNEIIITVGVSQGIDLALRSVTNPDDEIMYFTPSYVSYEPMIQLSGGKPVNLKTRAEDNFVPRLADMQEKHSPSLKSLLINYPSNPTGGSFAENDLKQISKFCIDNNLLVISDEIYAELSYDTKHIPLATVNGMKERTLLLGGFSKSFAMTGWRIAYACGPADWIQSILKIHQYSMLCAPTLSQLAALEALEKCTNQKDEMKRSYKKRRDYIVERFNQIGLECKLPSGAFYAFPSIQATGLKSMEFAKRLIAEENVAVVPGTTFGEVGEGFIRCSYATSLSEITEALNRIERFVQKLL